MSDIAITGCASHFARVLLSRLEADPQIDRIIGLDIVPPAETYSKLQFHHYDVRDPELKAVITGCETLVHLAFIVGRPFRMPLQEAASINLAGTWNICQMAAEAGVRKLVVSSSIAAYGSLPDNSDPLLEDSSPLRGLFTAFYYSQHKHANEIWLDKLQLAFPQLLISRARPCIVIGPHQITAGTMISQDKTYYTSPRIRHTRIQLIHEDDLADAFYTLIKHDLPGAYNVVGDEPSTMVQIAQQAGLQIVEVKDEELYAAAKRSWQEGKTPFGPEWIGGEEIICSNEKLKATGLWKPRYTTAQAYLETLAHL